MHITWLYLRVVLSEKRRLALRQNVSAESGIFCERGKRVKKERKRMP